MVALQYIIERKKPGVTGFKYTILLLDPETGQELTRDYADTIWGARYSARKLARQWRRWVRSDRYVDEGLI